jgi:hypothetical protein
VSSALHLLVRTAHLFGVLALVGGAAVVWLRLRRERTIPVAWLRGYEWLFWGSLGVVAATGVGNLGALGPPGPGTPWGRTLLVKLSIVGLLVVGSVPRTVAVVREQAGDDGHHDRHSRHDAGSPLLRRLYGTTALTLATLVTLAEVLAHG